MPKFFTDHTNSMNQRHKFYPQASYHSHELNQNWFFEQILTQHSSSHNTHQLQSKVRGERERDKGWGGVNPEREVVAGIEEGGERVRREVGSVAV